MAAPRLDLGEWELRLFLNSGFHPFVGIVEIGHRVARVDERITGSAIFIREVHLEHRDEILEVRQCARTDDGRGNSGLVLAP